MLCRFLTQLWFRLTKRVERMEGVIGNIVSKIDKVLIKLESMEKSKSKKKQNLGKLFDGLTNEDGGKIDMIKTLNFKPFNLTCQVLNWSWTFFDVTKSKVQNCLSAVGILSVIHSSFFSKLFDTIIGFAEYPNVKILNIASILFMLLT